MRVTLDINDNKAVAFLNFIQSLDFVTIKNDDEFQLSDLQKRAIDEALNQVECNKTFSHEEVMSEMKNRHPKYFK
jgi:DNA-binding protein YbaB